MGVAAGRINALGLERSAYTGRPSTLCKGCGHDSISSQIVAVAYELALEPHHMIKLSGIGCSSKSPAYFLGQTHGFNSLHGRMPSLATGATMANSSLLALGVSGDGDTGSIGLGQFKHMVRRNVHMVYIIENNGVYGLTKGQFSATADKGQRLKYAGLNELPAIDLCFEALAADATFVARSFAGDPKQVRELLKAAFSHGGTAILDIISPCVTFNNHDESTKSYSFAKANQEIVNELSYIPYQEEIVVDYPEGSEQVVELHDGSHIVLRKIDPTQHDPTSKKAAYQLLADARRQAHFVTGLIYIETGTPSMADANHLGETPLAHLPEEQTRPSREALDKIMGELMNR
jgi:2-oxoglutarate/2-oxoacid ferredoxin oxidoreductase subunit beta